MKELQGVNDKIIVKLIIIKEKKTEGGIILTDETAQNQEPQKYGIVESFGNDIKFDVKRGDILLFHNRAGMDMDINEWEKILRLCEANKDD